jgi:hypothetical protein
VAPPHPYGNLAEIRIVCNQNPLVLVRPFQNYRIKRAVEPNLVARNKVQMLRSEPCNDPRPDILVQEERPIA